MKKLLSGLCAATLVAATALTGMVVPASAQSRMLYDMQEPSALGNGLRMERRMERGLERAARREFRGDRREWRRDRSDWRGDRREWRREARRDRAYRRGFYRDGGYGWYNGHRGYSYYRSGYREYNGFWFPAGAFIAGAIIGGALNDGPVYRGGGGSAHVQWCYDRWRSYRDYDNTYQPYGGPRRQCISPYS